MNEAYPEVTVRSGTERRKSRRYPTAIKVKIKNGVGITKDCNLDGVFFFTDQECYVGEDIDFTLMFEHAFPDSPMRFNCTGNIRRIDTTGSEQLGVAVAITKQWYETLKICRTVTD